MHGSKSKDKTSCYHTVLINVPNKLNVTFILNVKELFLLMNRIVLPTKYFMIKYFFFLQIKIV